MKKTKLRDGTPIYCLLSTEAKVLDHHVEGYFTHGISLSPGATVFDVGANVGVFGVRTLQLVTDARIFAFEPVPAIYACLEANAAQLNQNGRERSRGPFYTYRAGISDRAGELSFTYYPNSPALSTAKPEQWDEHSLRDAVDGSISHPPPYLSATRLIPRPIRRLIAWWFAKRMRRGAQEVSAPLMTVSEVIEAEGLTQIDLLKVDCEGGELECFMGIKAEHWPLIQQVVVEVHDQQGALDQLCARLTEMGLSEQVIEQEEALRSTKLFNVFARRNQDSSASEKTSAGLPREGASGAELPEARR